MPEPRAAIVTGAGAGIGAAVARTFAAEGADVTLVGRRREPLEQVASEVRDRGGQALVVCADLARRESAALIAAETERAYGRIDVVVNNAAVLVTHPFGEVSFEELETHLAVNLRAPFLLIQASLAALRRSESGCVVNISSTAATTVRPEQAIYGMTKAGLEYLTRSLAAELAPEVRVNAVAPGPTDTPILSEWFGTTEAAWRWLEPQTPMGRIADPQEIAWWVARLCDPRGSFATGAIMPVDGGFALDFQ